MCETRTAKLVVSFVDDEHEPKSYKHMLSYIERHYQEEPDTEPFSEELLKQHAGFIISQGLWHLTAALHRTLSASRRWCEQPNHWTARTTAARSQA